MADGVAIDTSATNGDITLEIAAGPNGNDPSGDHVVEKLNAGTGLVAVANLGPTPGSDVLAASADAHIVGGNPNLQAPNDTVDNVIAVVNTRGELPQSALPAAIINTVTQAVEGQLAAVLDPESTSTFAEPKLPGGVTPTGVAQRRASRSEQADAPAASSAEDLSALAPAAGGESAPGAEDLPALAPATGTESTPSGPTPLVGSVLGITPSISPGDDDTQGVMRDIPHADVVSIGVVPQLGPEGGIVEGLIGLATPLDRTVVLPVGGQLGTPIVRNDLSPSPEDLGSVRVTFPHVTTGPGNLSEFVRAITPDAGGSSSGFFLPGESGLSEVTLVPVMTGLPPNADLTVEGLVSPGGPELPELTVSQVMAGLAGAGAGPADELPDVKAVAKELKGF